MILCDIDHFKRINDTHGHAVGDQVLIDFAGLLQSMAREAVDSVIRYGGEEFLIVQCPSLTPLPSVCIALRENF